MAFDKVIDSAVLDTKLTSVADAIRSKTGKTDKLTLEQMPGEIEGIQSGGGDDGTTELLEGTITKYSNSELTKVKLYGLAGCWDLKEVNLPNVLNVENYGFANDVALTTVNLPKATTVGTRAFDMCTGLKSIMLPNATALNGVSFRSCSGLESVILPVINGIAETFYGCTALAYAEFGAVTRIMQKAFNSCSSLKIVVIRTASVCTLDNVSAFTGTPFASGGTGGTVYVPSALIEQYQQATNWSTLYAAGTCNFVAIEGSEYE